MKTIKLVALFIIYNLTVSISYAQSPIDSVGSGCALDFNGVSNWVGLTNTVAYGISDLTIEFWGEITAIPSGQVKAILTNRNDGCCCPTNTWWVTAWHGGIGLSVGDKQFAIITSANVDDNQWHHFAFTRSGMVFKAYLDGILMDTRTFTYTINITTGISPQIGVSPCSPYWSGGGYFSGQIDDLRFWNKALTQTEIQQNMCKKLTGTETGLVGYWRFDDCGSLTATDATANGNNGTLN